MAETEVAEHPRRKHVRQPPAVPFLWEQKPGIPKKDWKPGVSSVSPIVTPPVKLIASIPFDWEEKPGTPLPYFSQPAVVPNPPEKLLALPPPPVCSQGYYGVNYDNDDDDDEDDDGDNRNGSFDFDTDDSFNSAPSLLANCLVPSAISSAVPVQRSFSSDNTSDELEIPLSPASGADSSTSSYATGTSGLVGASFLECLFPLLPPKSSFLEKAGYSKRESVTPQEVNSKDFEREGDSSVIIWRPTTLGEMIMMSRRRSYQRKVLPECNYNRNLRRWLLDAASLEIASKRSKDCRGRRTS